MAVAGLDQVLALEPGQLTQLRNEGLVDLAGQILLPTDTLNTTDLVSRRVRIYRDNPMWGALVDQLLVR